MEVEVPEPNDGFGGGRMEDDGRGSGSFRRGGTSCWCRGVGCGCFVEVRR